MFRCHVTSTIVIGGDRLRQGRRLDTGAKGPRSRRRP
jgi:hypothetical protein